MAHPRLLTRRRLLISSAIALALLAGFYACVPSMPIVAMPRRGRVVDKKTRRPIAGAEVFLTYTTVLGGVTVETRWTTTDAQGRFWFGPKVFDDVGTRTTFWPRNPEAAALHKEYHQGVVGFAHSGYQLPGYANPIELKAFDNDDKVPYVDPRQDYEDPSHIQSLCSGFTEPACEHACQWAYGLSVQECRRLRATQ